MVTTVIHTKCKKCKKIAHIYTFSQHEEGGYVCLNKTICGQRLKTGATRHSLTAHNNQLDATSKAVA